MSASMEERRARMVRDQLVARGIKDPAVLRAMGSVARERFVPAADRARAYDDGPLPIGKGQTISQPYMVAAMTELLALRPGDRVLEVGTGCGYQAAILAAVGAEVVSLERIAPLAAAARRRLDELGLAVHVVHGDGAEGFAERAPYRAVLVACGARTIPPALVEQLAPEGTLVIPRGEVGEVMRLIVVRKDEAGEVSEHDVMGVRFVPLLPGTQ